MKKYYTFSNEIANRIHNNPEAILEEAKKMKEIFTKQGNEKHSLEMNHIYSRAVFLEKVFYQELVPIYQTL